MWIFDLSLGIWLNNDLTFLANIDTHFAADINIYEHARKSFTIPICVIDVVFIFRWTYFAKFSETFYRCLYKNKN